MSGGGGEGGKAKYEAESGTESAAEPPSAPVSFELLVEQIGRKMHNGGCLREMTALIDYLHMAKQVHDLPGPGNGGTRTIPHHMEQAIRNDEQLKQLWGIDKEPKAK